MACIAPAQQDHDTLTQTSQTMAVSAHKSSFADNGRISFGNNVWYKQQPRRCLGQTPMATLDNSSTCLPLFGGTLHTHAQTGKQIYTLGRVTALYSTVRTDWARKGLPLNELRRGMKFQGMYFCALHNERNAFKNASAYNKQLETIPGIFTVV